MQIKELGHVVLYVSSLERSAGFYKDILGFKELHRGGGIALFSSGRTHHELLLIEVGGPEGVQRPATPGLYHIGFKIGEGAEAARMVYKELQEKRVPIVGTGDHGVTHSIYILDPDGNELELYSDIGDEWRKNPEAVLARVKPLRLD